MFLDIFWLAEVLLEAPAAVRVLKAAGDEIPQLVDLDESVLILVEFGERLQEVVNNALLASARGANTYVLAFGFRHFAIAAKQHTLQ